MKKPLSGTDWKDSSYGLFKYLRKKGLKDSYPTRQRFFVYFAIFIISHWMLFHTKIRPFVSFKLSRRIFCPKIATQTMPLKDLINVFFTFLLYWTDDSSGTGKLALRKLNLPAICGNSQKKVFFFGEWYIFTWMYLCLIDKDTLLKDFEPCMESVRQVRRHHQRGQWLYRSNGGLQTRHLPVYTTSPEGLVCLGLFKKKHFYYYSDRNGGNFDSVVVTLTWTSKAL